MNQPPNVPMETTSKTYTNQRAYQADLKRMTDDRWSVVSVTPHQPRSGCLRGCMLGLFALVWKPKPQLIVTYQRPRMQPPQQPQAYYPPPPRM